MFLENILDPLWRNHRKAADRVDASRFHQPKLVVQHFTYKVVGLPPQIVGVVLISGRIAPNYTLDIVVLAIDLQFPAIPSFTVVTIGGLVRVANVTLSNSETISKLQIFETRLKMLDPGIATTLLIRLVS